MQPMGLTKRWSQWEKNMRRKPGSWDQALPMTADPIWASVQSRALIDSSVSLMTHMPSTEKCIHYETF